MGTRGRDALPYSGRNFCQTQFRQSTLLGVVRFLVPKPFVSVEPTTFDERRSGGHLQHGLGLAAEREAQARSSAARERAPPRTPPPVRAGTHERRTSVSCVSACIGIDRSLIAEMTSRQRHEDVLERRGVRPRLLRRHVHRGHQRQGRSERNHPAVIDDRDAIAEHLRFVHVVRGQHDRAAGAPELGDQVPQLPAGLRDPGRSSVRRERAVPGRRPARRRAPAAASVLPTTPPRGRAVSRRAAPRRSGDQRPVPADRNCETAAGSPSPSASRRAVFPEAEYPDADEARRRASPIGGPAPRPRPSPARSSPRRSRSSSSCRRRSGPAGRSIRRAGRRGPGHQRPRRPCRPCAAAARRAPQSMPVVRSDHRPMRHDAVLRDDDDAVADVVERVVHVVGLAGGRDDARCRRCGRSCR